MQSNRPAEVTQSAAVPQQTLNQQQQRVREGTVLQTQA